MGDVVVSLCLLISISGGLPICAALFTMVFAVPTLARGGG